MVEGKQTVNSKWPLKGLIGPLQKEDYDRSKENIDFTLSAPPPLYA